jgi:hypothetical protein
MDFIINSTDQETEWHHNSVENKELWQSKQHYLKEAMTLSITVCSSLPCMKKQTVPEVQYLKKKEVLWFL